MPVVPVRRFQGFTLIELMVTLAVVAVLMVAAGPSFADFFDRYRLRGAADDVVSVISQARTDAVKLDRDVRVAFAGSGTAWCVGANASIDPVAGNPVAPAQACDCNTAAQCAVDGERLAVDPGKHPAIAVGALPASFVLSRKFGVVEPLAATAVTLSTGKYDLNVQVSPLGQTSLCVPAGSTVMSGIRPC